MNKTKGACNVLLCLGLAVAAAGAVFAGFYFSASKPVCPAIKPAVCPPAKPVAESPAPCAPADLSAQASFEGAAGTIYGTLSIKNISDKTCTIAGNAFPKLDYDQTSVKNLNVINLGIPSAKQFAIEPGSAVYAQIRFPNGPQCGSGINIVNATLSYAISPEISVAFDNVLGGAGKNQPVFSITACDAGKDITDVKITNLSDIPVQ